MSRRRTGVGIVGVGVISAEYVRTLQSAPDLEVRFLAARQPSRARARAEELGVPAFGTYDELLRDASIEVVVNLTVPQVHAEITEQALDSGRHVYSEKPLALAGGDGRRLVDLAASRGLRLGCAPDTFLGVGLQTALRTIRSGEIGTPRSAFANFQYGGPNLWHPNPEFLFQPGGGPLMDIGPYHLTALVQVFGAVARVSAQAIASAATRVIAEGPRAGEVFAVEVPTHVAALYEFEHGGVANVVLSFDAPISRVALEVTGTEVLCGYRTRTSSPGRVSCSRRTAPPRSWRRPGRVGRPAEPVSSISCGPCTPVRGSGHRLRWPITCST
jgi:predicted dehydrogenase